MFEHHRPACEWVGVDGTDEQTVMCGRPATEVVRERTGLRHFACREHLSAVRARAGTGQMVHRLGELPARPYPEAVL